MKYLIILFLIILPKIINAEINITNANYNIIKNKILIKNKIFKLILNIKGTIKLINFKNNIFNYTKYFKNSNLKIINIELHYLINYKRLEQENNTKFNFKLIYYIKPKKSGENKIPKIILSFVGKENFFNTFEKSIIVYNSYIHYLKNFFIKWFFIFCIIILLIWFLYRSPTGYKYTLEMKIFKYYLKIKKRKNINFILKLKKLILKYIRKKINYSLKNINILPFEKRIKNKIIRILNLSNKIYDGYYIDNLLEEDIKTILFEFQFSKIKSKN